MQSIHSSTGPGMSHLGTKCKKRDKGRGPALRWGGLVVWCTALVPLLAGRRAVCALLKRRAAIPVLLRRRDAISSLLRRWVVACSAQVSSSQIQDRQQASVAQLSTLLCLVSSWPVAFVFGPLSKLSRPASWRWFTLQGTGHNSVMREPLFLSLSSISAGQDVPCPARPNEKGSVERDAAEIGFRGMQMEMLLGGAALHRQQHRLMCMHMQIARCTPAVLSWALGSSGACQGAAYMRVPSCLSACPACSLAAQGLGPCGTAKGAIQRVLCNNAAYHRSTLLTSAAT